MYTHPHVANVIARGHERDLAKMMNNSNRNGKPIAKATARAFNALVNQMRAVSENRIR
ncbi:MAG: hypothetical protein AAF490_19840 [Chloroflexota bacterium]